LRVKSATQLLTQELAGQPEGIGEFRRVGAAGKRPATSISATPQIRDLESDIR
jgi:hypothetical protein